MTTRAAYPLSSRSSCAEAIVFSFINSTKITMTNEHIIEYKRTPLHENEEDYVKRVGTIVAYFNYSKSVESAVKKIKEVEDVLERIERSDEYIFDEKAESLIESALHGLIMETDWFRLFWGKLLMDVLCHPFEEGRETISKEVKEVMGITPEIERMIVDRYDRFHHDYD